MGWSRDKPTKPGSFFYRSREAAAKARLCEVVHGRTEAVLGLYVNWADAGTWAYACDLAGEWLAVPAPAELVAMGEAEAAAREVPNASIRLLAALSALERARREG